MALNGISAGAAQFAFKYKKDSLEEKEIKIKTTVEIPSIISYSRTPIMSTSENYKSDFKTVNLGMGNTIFENSKCVSKTPNSVKRKQTHQSKTPQKYLPYNEI